jgi:hypothetical protein
MIAFAAHDAAPPTVPDQTPLAPPVAPPAAPPAAPAPGKLGAGTMLGIAAVDIAAARAQLAASAPKPAATDLAATLPSTPPPAMPAPARPGVGGKTMLGVASPVMMPAGERGAAYAPTPVAPPVTGGVSLPKTAPEIPAARARTMVGGTAAQPLGGAGTSTLASQGALPAAPPAHAGTMLGLAVPGVAPLAATMPLDGGPAPVGLSPANQEALGARRPVRGKLANTALSDMAVLPPPAPYVDDVPMPAAPPVRSRSGVPLTLVAAIVSGLVLLVGAAVLLLYRSAPPLTAKPQLDAQDNEVLHLQCESCADGTTVTLDGAKATFRANQTDLALAIPLKVGNNDIALTLDRPGAGRDEQVKLVVPLAFRIRADLSQIDAKPPTILVRVAAAPGSDVTVDKKPLTLDSSGTGSYAIDVSADTDGPTEDVRLIDRRIDYTIAPPASGGAAKSVAPSSGQVTARVAVVPLRVDAPSAHAIVDVASFTVAGQTLAGGTVTVDGQPATVQPDGTFVATHAATTDPASIEIRASAPTHAPRSAHVTVKRATSFEAEAKAAEQAAPPPLTYDQIAPDIASKVGQRAVIAGEVLEAPRVAGHQAIVLVSDTRACKAGPCLARVIASEDVKLARGQSVRAYGTVTRAVTTSTGKTVPELQADFVARGKK